MRSIPPVSWVLLALALLVSHGNFPQRQTVTPLPSLPSLGKENQEKTEKPGASIRGEKIEGNQEKGKPEKGGGKKKEKPTRQVREVISLDQRLSEFKDNLVQWGYGSLVSQVNLQLFPYHQLEEKLQGLTGMDFSLKPLPRLRIKVPGKNGARALDQVAAFYKRGENTIYFDPTIISEQEKEATYHEFFHSKGFFEERDLNEGFVEYLTVLTTGLPPARYGIRAFNVHNLAFIVGLVAPESINQENDSGENKTAASTEVIFGRGLALLARAFFQESLSPVISLLDRHQNKVGQRLLVYPFRSRDELGFVRMAVEAENFLQSFGYNLQEYPQAEITMDNFGFINFPLEFSSRVISLYGEILHGHPDSLLAPHLKVALGNLYLKSGKYREAAKAYEEVLISSPGAHFPVAVVQLNLSTCYQKQGEWRKALIALEEVSNSPRPFLRAKGRFLRADIYAQQKQIGKALRELRWIQTQKLNDDNHWYLANSYLESGKLLQKEKSYRSALKEFIEGIRKFPDSVTAVESRLKMGEVYEQLRLYSEARDIYLCLVRERPQFHWTNQARFKLGNLYFKVYRDRSTALKYFREVIQRAPFSSEAEESREISRKINLEGIAPSVPSKWNRHPAG